MRTRTVAAVIALSVISGCKSVPVAHPAAIRESPPQNVVVWSKPGGFGGWPANNGVWSWGDEILVGFLAGTFKIVPGNHAIDQSKPQVPTLARSLDGGETWTLETFPRQGTAPAITDPEGIDFTNADFAMKVSGNRYFISYDRGHTWAGPMSFPTFDLRGIAGRTDYLVNGKRDCIAFLSANTTHGRDERPYCIRTTDGGRTWKFLSWIGPEVGGYAIMPASLRVSNNRIITAVRTQSGGRGWMPVYASDDDGKTWKLLSDATEIPGGVSNPPGMIKLKDGRIALTYGYRYVPYGIRARLSSDEGRTWSNEIMLRQDGGNGDLGYVRTVLRPDGKIVTIYYFNYAEDKERDIEATIWDPNFLPPTLSGGKPAGSLAAGMTEAMLTVETNIEAICKYDEKPGVPYAQMRHTFDQTGGRTHSTAVRKLKPGKLHTYYVKGCDAGGHANHEDFAITFFVTDLANPPYVARLNVGDARLKAPMTVVLCHGASQGEAICSPKPDEGRAEFSFNAPRAGDFVVWTRVLGPTVSNDSLFVSVDGGPEDIFDANAKLEAGHWRWVQVNGRGNGPELELALNPRFFKLAAGKHRLTFRCREPLTYLDKVVVTDDVHYMPEAN